MKFAILHFTPFRMGRVFVVRFMSVQRSIRVGDAFSRCFPERVFPGIHAALPCAMPLLPREGSSCSGIFCIRQDFRRSHRALPDRRLVDTSSAGSLGISFFGSHGIFPVFDVSSRRRLYAPQRFPDALQRSSAPAVSLPDGAASAARHIRKVA